ncbi:hypothetical protein P8452_00048 [Trifolium repens]|nr:hypothetical protein P8452_00048 [Trifolium repens]
MSQYFLLIFTFISFFLIFCSILLPNRLHLPPSKLPFFPSFHSPSSSSLHFPFNLKDEINSLGIAASNLIFYTFSPNFFSPEPDFVKSVLRETFGDDNNFQLLEFAVHVVTFESGFESGHRCRSSFGKHAFRALPERLTKLGFQEPSCAQHSGVSIFWVTAYCSQWLMVKVMVVGDTTTFLIERVVESAYELFLHISLNKKTCVAYNFFLAGISGTVSDFP